MHRQQSEEFRPGTYSSPSYFCVPCQYWGELGVQEAARYLSGRQSGTNSKTAKDSRIQAAETRHTTRSVCFLSGMSGFSGLSSSFWASSAELNGALPFEKSQKSLRVARSPQNLSKTDVFSGQESNQTEHIDSYGQGPGFYSQCHRKPDIPENRGTFLHPQRLILTGMVEPRQARGAYLPAT